ncbi:PP2C family protein-serine/threonine phosphatase [Actinomadura fibrosa]|uniref:PP2C family protein-serine/threonine phosphatase n=1 Tax=Actinomadura fibrosa TaxID=111802 RepID=A0ABW2XRK2_9ACTN|nr:PP2C family protein-serine/threonine phosphatase [Actinomadura fibrosa]
MSDERSFERALTGLLEASHLTSFDGLPGLIAEHIGEAGLKEVLVYLVDMQQTVLRLVTGRGLDAHQDAGAAPAERRVEGSLAGRAYQQVRILPAKGSGEAEASPGECWWVPLLDGTERLGVLRVRAAADAPAENILIERMRHLASLIALILSSVRQYSDSYARLVRTRPMNVAAEMEWNLLPPLTFANDRVAIGAVLEPAYEIGGDAFDYALADNTVHLAVFDAMGHDVIAGVTANLAMASCRNQRRQGTPLDEISDGIEAILLEEFGEDTRFVTGILADLDTRTGVLSWVNRGHHPPVIIREGRWTSRLSCPPAHPMGMDLNVPVTLCTEQLQPGDRLLLYTDGITEARDRHGREFGLQRFVDFVIRHMADGYPIPETLRRLIRTLLDDHVNSLGDDATVLLMEWHGPPGARHGDPQKTSRLATGSDRPVDVVQKSP